MRKVVTVVSRVLPSIEITTKKTGGAGIEATGMITESGSAGPRGSVAAGASAAMETMIATDTNTMTGSVVTTAGMDLQVQDRTITHSWQMVGGNG